jgi:uncharacterized protein (TIGR04255 family)
MDDVSFERAPVVELIAEAKWTPPGASGQVALATGSAVDEFFQKFGVEAHNAGFTQAEKTVPSGFPPMLHHVTWRYRKTSDAEKTLLQVGPGIFSANALQPYKRWKEFRPTVEQGFGALLATRIENERELPFSGLSLRYMNAFSDELLKEMSPAAFISEILGLKITLPEAVSALIDEGAEIGTNANFNIPIRGRTKQLSLRIGDGRVNNEPAAIFDITVSETDPTPSDLTEIMNRLQESRNIIHQCFVKLSEPLYDVMNPTGG